MRFNASRRDLEKIAMQLGTAKTVSDSNIVKDALEVLRYMKDDLSTATGLRGKGVSLPKIIKNTVTELNNRKSNLKMTIDQLQADCSVLEEERTAIRRKYTTIHERLIRLSQGIRYQKLRNKLFQRVHEEAGDILTGALETEPDQALENGRISTPNEMLGLVRQVAAELQRQREDAASAIADREECIKMISRSVAKRQEEPNEIMDEFETTANERILQEKTAAIKLKSEFNSIWEATTRLPQHYLNKDDSKQATKDVWEYLFRECWSRKMPPSDGSLNRNPVEERFPAQLPGARQQVAVDLDEIFARARQLQNALCEHNFSAHIGPVEPVDDGLRCPAVFVCMKTESSGCFGYGNLVAATHDSAA